MGRARRNIEGGLVYHALNRGNNRTDVFLDDADRLALLEALAQPKQRYPFRVFGPWLMTNHFHILMRPEPGQCISRILQSLTVAQTWRCQRRHRSSGHVRQGHFGSPVILDDNHLLVVLHHIEPNPLRARMVADPADFPWSSYQRHAMGKDDPLLDQFPEWMELGGS